MMNCNAENAGTKDYMIIHVVWSKSLIFRLQLNKLETTGGLGSIEGKCYEDVNVNYVFFIIATNSHKEFGNN